MNGNKHGMTYDSFEAYISKSQSIAILKDIIVSFVTCDVYTPMFLLSPV